MRHLSRRHLVRLLYGLADARDQIGLSFKSKTLGAGELLKSRLNPGGAANEALDFRIHQRLARLAYSKGKLRESTDTYCSDSVQERLTQP